MKSNTSITSIDLFKFVFSIFVVSIHTRVAGHIFNPFLKEVWILLSDSAVPFFFAVSGYFMYETVLLKDLKLLNKQLKKIALLYAIWSFLYLPINIYGEVVKYGHIDTWHINIIKGWVFTGDNYGAWILWYLLAFLVSLIIIRVSINKIQIKKLIIISLILYAVGGAYSMYHDTFQFYLYDHTFRTTRNGIFTGLTCICAGFVAAKYKTPNLLVLLTVLVLQFWVDRYIRFLLCGYIFLSIALRVKIHLRKSVLIRKCSGMIYFTHMFFVFIFKDLLGFEFGIPLFLVTVVSSLILSLTIVVCSSKYERLSFLKFLT